MRRKSTIVITDVSKALLLFVCCSCVQLPAQETPVPELRTRPPSTAESPLPGVRCITFDPSKLTVADVSKEEKKDNGNWLLVRKPQVPRWGAEARNQILDEKGVLRVIRFYNMDTSCWVDDPVHPFHFMLSQGKAPVGKIEGEDCFHLDHLNEYSVKRVSPPLFHIVTKRTMAYAFGTQQAAETALKVLWKYGFTGQCFVGRFMYFTAE